MKYSPQILIIAMLCIFSTTTFSADDDTTVIDIQVIHTPYVNLLGSLVGASKYFSIEDIKPLDNSRSKVTLGLLGLESNVSGSCTLDFSTQNNFKLRHIVAINA